MVQDNDNSGSRLLRVIEAIAISPADAMAIAKRYKEQSRNKYPFDSEDEHRRRVADKIIQRYSRFAMTVGGVTALPGTIPGLGTAASVIGGATADTAACMKLQVDMCMCLAAAFEYNITSEDGRHLVFLIAATGSIQRAGGEAGVKLGTRAGVRILRQYLRGAALQAVKHAFRRVGITFTRKAVERAIPFGVGVAIGAGANYGLTRYVGHQAKQWFIIDSSMEPAKHIP